MTATLNDSKAARDFTSLLPLSMEDYAKIEKISYLPKRLLTEGAPVGSDSDVGILLNTRHWEIRRFFIKISATRTDASSSEG